MQLLMDHSVLQVTPILQWYEGRIFILYFSFFPSEESFTIETLLASFYSIYSLLSLVIRLIYLFVWWTQEQDFVTCSLTCLTWIFRAGCLTDAFESATPCWKFYGQAAMSEEPAVVHHFLGLNGWIYLTLRFNVRESILPKHRNSILRY